MRPVGAVCAPRGAVLKPLRGAARLLRLLGHIALGLATVLLRFPRLSPQQQGMRVQAWAMALLGHLGIALQVRGPVPRQGPVLLVANHLSWLDIPVIHASQHCRFVSKSDVKAWPVIGGLASAAGTLFIERNSRRDAMRTVSRMEEAIRKGDMVAVFPEGTTGDGRDLLPFHANLIQAAISAHAPVMPVALDFVDGSSGHTTCAPSYIGDETLLGSIWRTVCAPPIVAVVNYGPPEQAQGRDRRTWSAHLQAQVDVLRQR